MLVDPPRVSRIVKAEDSVVTDEQALLIAWWVLTQGRGWA
jgi:hypothetical protein